jgi:predicted nucleic acid-binding Zn ribbon protein
MPSKKKSNFTPLQRRVLREWRGYDAEEDDGRWREHSVQDLLQAIMRRTGMEDRATEEELAAAWAQAAGPFISQHSRPFSLHEGVLWITVLQPSIRYSLQGAMKQQILERLRTALPQRAVRELRFTIG